MKCYKKDYPRPQFVRDNWVNLNGTRARKKNGMRNSRAS